MQDIENETAYGRMGNELKKKEDRHSLGFVSIPLCRLN